MLGFKDLELLPVPDAVAAAVTELVDRYRLHRDRYRGPNYNEARLRQEFINPLFAALGWDMQNRQGYAEPYKEVIHEDTVRVGDSTRAPDYCFRLMGQPKFYVEAKAPSVDVAGAPAPAYQLRRYGWSAKLPLSVLTDFEEFAIYDCRAKPSPTDPARTARQAYLTFDQYPENLQALYSIFGREALPKGFFDRYAEQARGRRGTATVDAEFLAEIERWRDELARNIALRNDISVEDLNFAVQSIIDRLLFLRIAEDRGIEPQDRLQSTAAGGRNIYPALCGMFHEADAKYNSGLFDFSARGDEFTTGLQVDDRILRDIIANLYPPKSPYEFSVISADILGAVYEQFLGKVIRLTKGGYAKVEEKPEVKKAGGVYYTPKYIVDYIVEHTVGAALADRAVAVDVPLSGAPQPHRGARERGRGEDAVDVAVPLRILDPACGSGSFLLGAYDRLLRWRLEQLLQDDPAPQLKARRPLLVRTAAGDWKLSIAERKRLLQTHIFGVDLDRQAVEVAKLNLLLKCLEGETEQTLKVQQALFATERVLPNIDGNIKCGNSLIGPDYFTGRLEMDDEEYERVKPFDWQREFPEIMREGGFDCVIGNPPYVVMSTEFMGANEIGYLTAHSAAQYKTDLYQLFLQRGVELLKPDGKFGYIMPNTWLTLQFSDKLRRWVLHNCAVDELVLFEHLVFANARVHTALVFLTHMTAPSTHEVRIKHPGPASDAAVIQRATPTLVRQADWLQNCGSVFETRLVGDAGQLVVSLVSRLQRLDRVARVSLGCQAYNSSKHTPDQIAERVFHSEVRENGEYLPELAGSDVDRYHYARVRGKWIRYGPWLHDYRPMDWLQGPRLLVREIPGRPPHMICGVYLEDTYCNYKTILNVNPSSDTNVSMKYLLGVINSSLVSFLYPYMSNKMVSKTFPRVSVGDLKKLPIRPIDFSSPADVARHDRMVALVQTMLDLHSRLPEAANPHTRDLLARQIEDTDRAIDQLVYELYDLTPEEIAIVEGRE